MAVESELSGRIPSAVLARFEVRVGQAAVVIREVVTELGAGLVVLGGKHHTALGRLVVGSTAHTLARTIDVPLLVTAPGPWPVKQIVAAIDLSDAADPTIMTAVRFAEMLGAKLHVLHAVEPLPVIPDTPLRFNDDEVFEQAQEYLERYVWPRVDYPGATKALRRGTAAETIAAEAADRGANLVVVGSHGKGWVDRILIGSITERVLTALPTSVLVVPVVGPTSGCYRRRSAVFA